MTKNTEARVACPFCGGEAATEVDDEDFDVARGICKDCGACGPFVDLSDYPTTAAARDAAGTAWDSRAAPPTTLDTIGSHFGNGGGFDPGRAGGEAVPHRWKGVIPLIEQITVEEGASVTFVCANPDFNGLPNEAVTVFQGEDWQEVTYRDDTLADCLRAALENKATP